MIDTFGELGVFYRLCEIVFLGGSLIQKGGHNLVEPAQLDCALLHGPYMMNQLQTAALFKNGEAAAEVKDAHELEKAVEHLLLHPAHRQNLIKAAQHIIQKESCVIERVWSALEPYRTQFEPARSSSDKPATTSSILREGT